MSHSERSRKASETRKANTADKLAEWEERGKFEQTRDWYATRILGKGVTIARPKGKPVARTSDDGVPSIEVGDVWVSLDEYVVIPREGLHPSSELWLFKFVAEHLRYWSFGPNGVMAKWQEQLDESGTMGRTCTVVRLIGHETGEESIVDFSADEELAFLLLEDSIRETDSPDES